MHARLTMLTTLLLLAPPGRAQDGALRLDEVVAGGPEAFTQVRHLVLRGTQHEIGRALAEVARDTVDVTPWPSDDERVTRVQARYFADVWPEHHARMLGAAAAFGGDPADHGKNWSVLGYDLGDAFGCTVAYYPPGLMESGQPVMSRNLDFTSGTTNGRRPDADQRAAMSRPFIIESYPDEGYASLFTSCMDLLGSAFDGVNEMGLTVALLSDRELMNEYDMVPTGDLAVGLSEIQVPRYLLETCANVDEAMDALLRVRQYYAFLPCHYILGDRSGRAVVFEASHGRNSVHFIEKPGEVLVTTNFMLHRNDDPLQMASDGPKSSIGRYQAVCAELERVGAPFDERTLINAHARAAFDGPGPPPHIPHAPNRTLWHALYSPATASLKIDFYLGEAADPYDPMQPIIERSGYLKFELSTNDL